MSDDTIGKYVDLAGVLIIASTLSLLLFDVSTSALTGEVGFPEVLILQIPLVYGSYLSVFLPACSFERLFKIPRWVWVSVVGSLACSLTYLEPLIGFDLDRSLLSFVGFSFYSAFILGGLNFKDWSAKLLKKHSSGPVPLFPKGASIRKP